MIKFKYQSEPSSLGKIKRPVANVFLETESVRIEASMYIDSGADITMIPLRLGLSLGFRQSPNDKILEIRGVSGGGVPYIIKEAFLTMDKTKIKFRLAWALIEEVPLLLGRMDIFDKFKILFNERRNLITFTPL